MALAVATADDVSNEATTSAVGTKQTHWRLPGWTAFEGNADIAKSMGIPVPVQERWGHQLRRPLFSVSEQNWPVRIAEAVHAEVMTSEGEVLTHAEFASLLLVGHLRSAFDPPAVIPAEHSARLIALGYMIDLAGSLRMTTQGRIRIYAGQLANWGGQKGSSMISKIKEHKCVACNGTGFPVVMQPVQPGRKIYPVKCTACAGKGRITDANWGGL